MVDYFEDLGELGGFPGRQTQWAASLLQPAPAPMPELQVRLLARFSDEPLAGLIAIWLRYLSFGGRSDTFELWAYLCGALQCSADDTDRLEHAMWELETFAD